MFAPLLSEGMRGPTGYGEADTNSGSPADDCGATAQTKEITPIAELSSFRDALVEEIKDLTHRSTSMITSQEVRALHSTQRSTR